MDEIVKTYLEFPPKDPISVASGLSEIKTTHQFNILFASPISPTSLPELISSMFVPTNTEFKKLTPNEKGIILHKYIEKLSGESIYISIEWIIMNYEKLEDRLKYTLLLKILGMLYDIRYDITKVQNEGKLKSSSYKDKIYYWEILRRIAAGVQQGVIKGSHFKVLIGRKMGEQNYDLHTVNTVILQICTDIYAEFPELDLVIYREEFGVMESKCMESIKDRSESSSIISELIDAYDVRQRDNSQLMASFTTREEFSQINETHIEYSKHGIEIPEYKEDIEEEIIIPQTYIYEEPRKQNESSGLNNLAFLSANPGESERNIFENKGDNINIIEESRYENIQDSNLFYQNITPDPTQYTTHFDPHLQYPGKSNLQDHSFCYANQGYGYQEVPNRNEVEEGNKQLMSNHPHNECNTSMGNLVVGQNLGDNKNISNLGVNSIKDSSVDDTSYIQNISQVEQIPIINPQIRYIETENSLLTNITKLGTETLPTVPLHQADLGGINLLDPISHISHNIHDLTLNSTHPEYILPNNMSDRMGLDQSISKESLNFMYSQNALNINSNMQLTTPITAGIENLILSQYTQEESKSQIDSMLPQSLLPNDEKTIDQKLEIYFTKNCFYFDEKACSEFKFMCIKDLMEKGKEWDKILQQEIEVAKELRFEIIGIKHPSNKGCYYNFPENDFCYSIHVPFLLRRIGVLKDLLPKLELYGDNCKINRNYQPRDKRQFRVFAPHIEMDFTHQRNKFYINNQEGELFSLIISKYLEFNDKYPIILYCLYTWAKYNKLLNFKEGGLHFHTLCFMLIFILQKLGMVPPLNDEKFTGINYIKEKGDPAIKWKIPRYQQMEDNSNLRQFPKKYKEVFETGFSFADRLQNFKIDQFIEKNLHYLKVNVSVIGVIKEFFDFYLKNMNDRHYRISIMQGFQNKKTYAYDSFAFIENPIFTEVDLNHHIKYDEDMGQKIKIAMEGGYNYLTNL